MEVYKSTHTSEAFNFALGAVPSIGENGNWWIGDVDTGVLASGLQVSGAEVGQTLRVSAVDKNGVPTAWEAVDSAAGKWELIGSYVHEGNLVVQPDSLDITTGVWTVNAGHGLSTGDLLSIFTNSDTLAMDYNTKTKMPVALFNQGVYAITVTVIDDKTFTLTTGNGGGTAISYAECTAIDCSLFRFERKAFNTMLCQFTGLDGYKELKVRVYGQSGANNIQIIPCAKTAGKFHDKSIAVNRNGTVSSVYASNNARYSGDQIASLSIGNAGVYSEAEITLSMQDGRTTIVGNGKSTFASTAYGGQSSIFRWCYEWEALVTKITMNMYYKSFVANGFTVEVYAK